MMSIWWVCPPHQARAVRPGWPGAAPSPEPGHDPNPAELIEYPPRIRGCWLFVHADVPVIGCSRFLTDAPRVFGRAAAELESLNFTDLFAPPARPSWIGRLKRVFTGETLGVVSRFGEGAAFSIAMFPI